MDAKEIIKFISESEKKTPVRVFVKANEAIQGLDDRKDITIFRMEGNDCIVFGDWEDIKVVLEDNKDKIKDYIVENDCRNSAIPLLDLKDINARIEPGAIIRDQVEIGDNVVIMMGAVINIGSVIGDGTMIDMGAILGGRATVGKNCHIGAGAVLAGVIEPPSATPVIIEDDVLVGANAVILEGVRIGKGSVVAAGAIVVDDVEENSVVAGVPAKHIKDKTQTSEEKVSIVQALRQL